ncbi:hypothetical protein GMMP15_320012 [Candidatus Magnetomoraceae bacterium gMMP-15]
MKFKSFIIIGFCFLALGMVIGCGNGDDNIESPAINIEGTVSNGNPINGIVTVRDSNGNEKEAPIDADGYFTINVSDMVESFIVWSTDADTGEQFYAATDSYGMVNLTPVTDTIIEMALGEDPYSKYSLGGSTVAPNSTKINEAKDVISSMLEEVYTDDMPDNFDVISDHFMADDDDEFNKILKQIELFYDKPLKVVELKDKNNSPKTALDTETRHHVVVGTASAGYPIPGTVTVKANGTELTSSINGDNGSFKVDVEGLTGPFIVWSEEDTTGERFYGAIEAPGRVNITPATDAIMETVLGEDPDDKYRDVQSIDPSDFPNFDELDRVENDLAVLLENIYGDLMPDDFDIIRDKFDADGTKFDMILNIAEFIPGDPIQIKDKLSNELFDLLSLSSTEIASLVEKSKKAAEDSRSIFETIEAMFATANPSPDSLSPYISENFLDEGYKFGQDWIDNVGPISAFDFIGVPIYHEMKDQPFDQKGNNYAGMWCRIKYKEGDAILQKVTSFVQKNENDDWQWNGDQNPFREGGDIDAEAIRVVYSTGNPDNYSDYTGLGMFSYDKDQLAGESLAISNVVIHNEALPQWTNPIYNAIELESVIVQGDNKYQIKDPPVLAFNYLYPEYDELGNHRLNIDNITNPEFIFVGYDSAFNQQHVWIDLLRKNPVKTADLKDENFAKNINQQQSTNNNSQITEIKISWTNPPGMYTKFLIYSWSGSDGSPQGQSDDVTVENPDRYSTNWNLYSINSKDGYSLDYYSLTTITRLNVKVNCVDQYDRQFTISKDLITTP